MCRFVFFPWPWRSASYHRRESTLVTVGELGGGGSRSTSWPRRRRRGGSERAPDGPPEGWLPPCDPAAGIFGAEGGGEAGPGYCGGGAFLSFISSLSPSSPDINLCRHPPLAPRPPPSVSSPCPPPQIISPPGCVRLVTGSFPKWLVLHRVSVCMMCWVSLFYIYILVSSFLYFMYIRFKPGIGVCSAVYTGKPSPTCPCFWKYYCSLFPASGSWCSESSSSALFRSESEKLELFRANLSSPPTLRLTKKTKQKEKRSLTLWTDHTVRLRSRNPLCCRHQQLHLKNKTAVWLSILWTSI